jgi:enoyl-CoA hydratase
MDMVLTGRPVGAEEAARYGLVNRLVEPGQALPAARELAAQLAQFPQAALRGDRLSLLEQWGMGLEDALRNERRRGQQALSSGEGLLGARRFAAGEGRAGSPLSS